MNNTGGKNANLRVLCTVHLCQFFTTYETFYIIFKVFGYVERYKLKLGMVKGILKLLQLSVTKAAQTVLRDYDGLVLSKTKLISSRKFPHEDFDFIPSLDINIGNTRR